MSAQSVPRDQADFEFGWWSHSYLTAAPLQGDRPPTAMHELLDRTDCMDASEQGRYFSIGALCDPSAHRDRNIGKLDLERLTQAVDRILGDSFAIGEPFVKATVAQRFFNFDNRHQFRQQSGCMSTCRFAISDLQAGGLRGCQVAGDERFEQRGFAKWRRPIRCSIRDPMHGGGSNVAPSLDV